MGEILHSLSSLENAVRVYNLQRQLAQIDLLADMSIRSRKRSHPLLEPVKSPLSLSGCATSPQRSQPIAAIVVQLNHPLPDDCPIAPD